MLILYSTGCPKCRILEKKLRELHVEFSVVSDPEIMLQKGFTSVPMLETDGRILGYSEAYAWVKNLEDENRGKI